METLPQATESAEPKATFKRDTSVEAIAARRARTDAFLALLASLPVLETRTPREIMDDLNEL